MNSVINQIKILLHHQEPQLLSALELIIAHLPGSGGRIYITPEYINFGLLSPQLYQIKEQPITSQLDQYLEETWIWKKITQSNSDHPNLLPIFIKNIYQEPALTELIKLFESTKIYSILILPLTYRQQFLGYLTLFRNIILPEWKPQEIEIAQEIAHELAIAIYTQGLISEINSLNSHLEHKVELRTLELTQSLQFAQIMQQVTETIRDSLDYHTTLQTIIQQTLNLFKPDRAVIYKFTGDRTGEVILEAIQGQWSSVKNITTPPGCFSPNHNHRLQTKVIHNIFYPEITPCHRDFLLNIGVQASISVPILHHHYSIWGYLIIHQCENTRLWQPIEIRMLEQLGQQAAIAIKQAEIHHSSQVVAKQNTKTSEELAKIQSQLVQSEKMSSLGQLVAGVAHEINNPVNFIYGNLNHADKYIQDLLELIKLYQRYYCDPPAEIADLIEEIDLEFLEEDLPKLFQSMQIGTDRIRQIVLSLRNFSRHDQSDKKPVDIHSGIDSTLVILQHRLKTKTNPSQIELIKNYGTLPLVNCHASQFNQVIMNLIANAIDALEERDQKRSISEIEQSPSKITITTQHHPHPQLLPVPHVVIKIADNGIGIPPEIKHQIFNPFFTTKPVGKGTGLGLSITYQIIVEKHKGHIECNSNPNQGTEFIIAVPIE